MRLRILRHATAAALAFAIGTVTAAPKIGELAPTFSATSSLGNTIRLADYAGKLVVMEWTNDGCPFVQKHYQGNMQGLQRTATEKGVIWLSVISSAPGKQGHVTGAQAEALTAQRGAAPTAVLLDESGAIGRLYGAQTTPHMFIIDQKGMLIYAGGIDSVASADVADIAKARPHVQIALEEALADKPISLSLTKPYGCSVKY